MIHKHDLNERLRTAIHGHYDLVSLKDDRILALVANDLEVVGKLCGDYVMMRGSQIDELARQMLWSAQSRVDRMTPMLPPEALGVATYINTARGLQ